MASPQRAPDHAAMLVRRHGVFWIVAGRECHRKRPGYEHRAEVRIPIAVAATPEAGKPRSWIGRDDIRICVRDRLKALDIYVESGIDVADRLGGSPPVEQAGIVDVRQCRREHEANRW